MPKLFGKKKKVVTYEGSDSESDSYSSSDSEEAQSVRGFEHPKAPTRRVDPEDYSDCKPEFTKKARDTLPPGTQYVILPEVGNEVLQSEFNIYELSQQLGDLKRKVRGLQDLVNDAIFTTDDNATAKKIQEEMEDTLMLTAILHKRLTSLPPGLEVVDFLPQERELYDSVSSDLFGQLSMISEVKIKYNKIQEQKLRKTMKIVHPELNDSEINERVEEALMDGDLLVDSSQMFAQQIIDDRYKREEAKIALMYAREQRRELEQIEKSIAQLHQMSVDLAALVQGQGEILDQMEVSIGNAVADSVKGLKMLEVAEAHKISARKKKIIIGVIVGITVAVTVLTIAGIVAGVICLCS